MLLHTATRIKYLYFTLVKRHPENSFRHDLYMRVGVGEKKKEKKNWKAFKCNRVDMCDATHFIFLPLTFSASFSFDKGGRK